MRLSEEGSRCFSSWVLPAASSAAFGRRFGCVGTVFWLAGAVLAAAVLAAAVLAGAVLAGGVAPTGSASNSNLLNSSIAVAIASQFCFATAPSPKVALKACGPLLSFTTLSPKTSAMV